MRAFMSLGMTFFLIGVCATVGHATDAANGPSAKLVSVSRPVFRHGVFRHSSYPVAWTSAQKSKRPILVFACSQNCPHCVRMIGETYQSAQIKRMVNDSFETVYVDRSEQPELAAKLHVRYFPTTYVVSPNNKVLDVIEGYVDSNTLAKRLQTTIASNESATTTR